MLGLCLNITLYGCNTGSSSLVPAVLTSKIVHTNVNAIYVIWDRKMHGTTDAKKAIEITVNGIGNIHPTSVTFGINLPNEMILLFPTAFAAKDIVTWAYTDQHPTGKLTDVNGTEAGTNIHRVNNTLVATADWVNSNGVGWVDENMNNWTVK